MKNYYNLFRKLLISALFLLGTIGAISQVKIGTTPTRINKSSILELESDRQGLLLTRLTDTLAINTLTPPDGMLIYLSSTTAASRGLYIRKSGIWQKIRTDSSSVDKWSKTGDALTGTEKLGSLNAQTLRMITNNIERMSVDGSTGNITINKSLTVTDTTSSRRLIVGDSVRFKSLNRSSSLTEILLIDTTTGSVQRRAIATDAFRNWVVGNMSLTANAKGLSRVTGTNGTDTMVLHAATQTTGGGVSTTTQTFGGNKTFNDSLTVNKGSTLNGGTMANGGLTVSGATGTTAAVSNLKLGVTSTTTPELVTDKYLSVNSTGQVTLNEANIITNRQLKVKVYTKRLDGLPQNLNNTVSKRFTFTFVGENLSTTSSIIVTPLFSLRLGCSIDYSRVVDANTIEIVMSNRSGAGQPFTNGTDGTFNITVIEF